MNKHACFHAQQAVEKARKGLLLHRTARIPKVHQLSKLLHAVRTTDPTFPDHSFAARTSQNYEWAFNSDSGGARHGDD
ncbi:MAG: HEPN domain-containing protein [Planctomycetes bacterium]|nr:HEPN domain-containing protein [Planctomycetota bacterium]